MRLPIKNFLPKKEKPEYLLALLLRDEKVSAVVVQQSEANIKVIGQHQEYISSSLDELPHEELLDLLDRTISKAEETLPPEIETKKTVFGVKDEWVEDKKISKEHLAKLKKISDALDLQPIGFLVVSEAVAHLIQEEEGAPLSAVLAEIGNKSVNLVLFRGGKIVESKSGPIEDSPMHTVDTLLKHFTIEVLPSRIIVFGGRHDQNLAQKFISHAWSKSLPFLHVPQVSVLPENFDARSIVFGAATQLNLDVIGEIVDKTGSEIQTFEKGEEVALDNTESERVEQASSGETSSHTHEDVVPLSGDNFGFVTDEDIATVRPTGQRVDETEEGALAKHSGRGHRAEQEYEDQDEKEGAVTSPIAKLQSLLLPIAASLQNLPKLLKKGNLPALRGGKTKLLVIPIILIILFIILGMIYASQVKSTITLSLNPKVIQQTETVTLSPDAVNDFSKHTLQAAAVSSTLEGTVSTPATGKKDVGEKAKGTITLYNNNDSKKTIPAGTIVTSSNNLDYVLDQEVTIASESGDVFTGTKPGTATGTVTAKNIGPEYNLPSNTKFNTVSGFSNVAAKNDTAFSGGSKKQVTVVSSKDIDKLLSELPKSLEEKAQSDLKTKVESGESLLPGFIDETIATKSFDKKVDDEAKTVTLKGKVTFEGLTYKNADLTEFATSALKNNFAQDLHISDKGVSTEILSTKKKDTSSFELQLALKANLLPTIDTESIIKNLAGKSEKEAMEYISGLPQVSHSQITFSPSIPLLPKVLPRKTDHIKIEIKSNE